MEPRERVVNLVREYFGGSKASLADVQAIYLWGSILRLDFDPDSSDIDCVAIGGLNAEPSDRVQLRDDARARHKELAQLNLRSLYTCDLNGVEPHSELAQLIDPRLLLADFSSWVWVWGRPLSLSSFTLRPCNLQEAYSIRRRALKRRLRRCLAVPRTEAPRYALKEAGYFIHLIHQLRRGIHSFSYAELERRSDERTNRLSRAIVSARSHNWPDIECERAVSLIQELLDQTTERNNCYVRIGIAGRSS